MLPKYTFKPNAEFWWYLLTTLVLFLAITGVTFDPTKITDWRVWIVVLGGGAVRAVAGAVLHMLVGPEPPTVPTP